MNIDQSIKLYRSHWLYISLIAIGFAVWGIYYIINTAYVDPESGTRYFILFDDAMISMRYAYNLANGNGLVWNSGEYVEGITNLLMTLYMSLMSLFFDKSGAILAVQLSGIVFVLTTCYFCLKVGELLLQERGLPKTTFVRILFFLSPIIYYPLVFWSLMGMENGLLAALLSAAIYVAMSRDSVNKVSILLPTLLGLAYLTRPDAAIAVALIMLYRTLGLFSYQGIRTVFIEGLIISLFVFGLGLFRYFYYGEMYPNTYLLKVVGMPFDLRISNGLIFVIPFIKTTALPIFLGIISVALSFNRKAALLIAILLAMISYQVYVGGDAFILWRMFVAIMPFISVLYFVEIYALSNDKLNDRSIAQPSVLAFALLSLIFIYNWDSKQHITLDISAGALSGAPANMRSALALNEITKPDATVGVFFAGIIPYYTERPAYDFLGKADKHIASLDPDLSGAVAAHGMTTQPGHNKYDLNYSIKELQPDFIQNYRWGQQNLTKYVRRHYKVVYHNGVALLLKRNSPSILWDKINHRH